MAWTNPMMGPYGTSTPITQVTPVTPVTPVMPIQNQPAASNPIFLWVKSEDEANSFMPSPGQTVILMNENELVMYIKSTDMSGRSLPIEIYDLTKRGDKAQAETYVKKNEIEQMISDAVSKAVSERFSKRNDYKRNNRRSQEGVNEDG